MKVTDGELFTKVSEKSMLGYLNTETKFVPSLDGNGHWYGTKDLVEVKGDRVKFMGRQDHVINVGGFKVSPNLVESTIRCVPGVKEVVVTGKKNPICGYLVKAKVWLAEEKKTEEARKEILDFCKQNLPYYAIPLQIEFTKDLDYASSFKLKRKNS